MRIAILTQPLHNNYGGILQNYALQVVLKGLGHDPVTLDLSYNKPNWPFYVRVIKFVWRFVKRLFGDKSILFSDLERQWVFMNRPGKNQKRFVQAYIDSLHFVDKLNDNFCSEYAFDAFIVGSDQVWRPRFSPYLPNYFLDFTQGAKVKRLSYAASFGTDKWEGTAAETVQMIPWVQQFDAVSVREKSGVSLCWNTFGVRAQCVLDPTLLVNKNEYVSLLTSEINTMRSPYLAVYVLDDSKSIRCLVKKVCKKLNLKAVYLGVKSKKGFPSIESWISGIFNSNYVLTDSFHGTVFSIIAHKPFTTVINSGRGASRFESLLGDLGLMDRLTSAGNPTISDYSVDYSTVDAKLVELKEQSLNFLKHNLDGEHHS